MRWEDDTLHLFSAALLNFATRNHPLQIKGTLHAPIPLPPNRLKESGRGPSIPLPPAPYDLFRYLGVTFRPGIHQYHWPVGDKYYSERIQLGEYKVISSPNFSVMSNTDSSEVPFFAAGGVRLVKRMEMYYITTLVRPTRAFKCNLFGSAYRIVADVHINLYVFHILLCTILLLRKFFEEYNNIRSELHVR